jgi:hypothetical protein
MYKLKSDKYRKSRGGYSRVIKLSCAKCGQLISFYQKDGPGTLKRVYLDRLIEWSKLGSELRCDSCKTLLGNYSIYKKENRPAYMLIPDAISKKLVKMSDFKDL